MHIRIKKARLDMVLEQAVERKKGGDSWVLVKDEVLNVIIAARNTVARQSHPGSLLDVNPLMKTRELLKRYPTCEEMKDIKTSRYLKMVINEMSTLLPPVSVFPWGRLLTPR
ncbi:hypothetical protein BDQ17DRAFT_1326775 [Cyathus striatus]|nr:hypothetical protein BDQ17DRAFT_1326775 [Cyathus striatus]